MVVLCLDHTSTELDGVNTFIGIIIIYLETMKRNVDVGVSTPLRGLLIGYKLARLAFGTQQEMKT